MLTMYLAGRICYKDIFKQVHWTDFCTVWPLQGDGLAKGAGCDYGNDADSAPLPPHGASPAP